jgi:hypothetical protein
MLEGAALGTGLGQVPRDAFNAPHDGRPLRTLGVSQCQEYGRCPISPPPRCISSARIAAMNSTETRHGSSETDTPSPAQHCGRLVAKSYEEVLRRRAEQVAKVTERFSNPRSRPTDG